MAARRIELPDLDLAKITRFCERRVPARVRDQVRLEVEVRGRAVTIVERRVPWRPELGPDWTRLSVARLRYIRSEGGWVLYWADRNERWHRYTRSVPSPHVDPLLAEIEADPTAIFWG
jgi:hypothetical protein